MKTTSSLRSIIAIGFLSISIAMPACEKEKAAPTITPVKNNIAYIYKSDDADGLAYKSLMELNDCHVTLIDKAQAATTDYSPYKLIVS